MEKTTNENSGFWMTDFKKNTDDAIEELKKRVVLLEKKIKLIEENHKNVK